MDSKDKNDRTPLSWTAENGHLEIVKLLVEKDVDADSECKTVNVQSISE